MTDWGKDWFKRQREQERKANVSVNASLRQTMRDLTKLQKELSELRSQLPGKHGKLVHFSFDATTYGDPGPRYLCIKGHWLTDGVGMDENGAMMDLAGASVHAPNECPNP